MQTFSELIFNIQSDLFRYSRQSGFLGGLRCGYDNPGFKLTFWFRVCSYLVRRPIFKFFYYCSKIIYYHYRFKFGIEIPIGLNVGSGFYIGHFGGIVVGKNTKIGKNCNLSHGVTIGRINRGINKGEPVIGDNVYIGPGAKLIGKIIIGDGSAIGANCVVLKNVPNNAVVVGIPGKVISYKGSEGYVNNTDY